MDSSMRVLLVTAVCCIASYLVCGIPFGKILGKRLGNVDIQQAGSGNIGTTNALRVAGPKVAALTLLFDLLKGTVCVVVARYAIPAWGYCGPAAAVAPGAPGDWLVVFVALASLYGHIFSPYLHFHGGKGIATGVGILFGYFWPLALVHLGIFIVLVALTRYVSLGSIVTAGLVPLTMYLAFPSMGAGALALWALLGWTVVWAHRSNIRRLRAGKESKLSFGKRVTTKDDD